MGSVALMDPPDLHDDYDDGVKKKKNKPGPSSKKKASNAEIKEKKRSSSCITEELTSRKIPKQFPACLDFKEVPLDMSKKLEVIEMKKDQSVEEEAIAIRLTAGQEDGRPCRRLVDYIFHSSDGIPQPFEMLEVDDVFISGLILPLEDSVDKEKAIGVRSVGFGRIEEWVISGYEDGSPVIWVSTHIADYDCLMPSGRYKKHYDQFFAKASASVEVYKKLSKSAGGNPDLTLDGLLAGVVRAMSDMKCFSGVVSIREFVISQGEFIYNQLIGLDEISKKTDQLFLELPVLAALRDECCERPNLAQAKVGSAYRNSKIGSEERHGNNMNYQSVSSNCPLEEDEDLKLARLLHDEEYWHSMKPKESQGVKKIKNKPGPASKNKASALEKKEEKISISQITLEPTSRKMPKQAAAGFDFNEKPPQMSKKSVVVEMKKDQSVEEEAVAIRLTAGQENGRPCRRLVDYIFHNSDGIPQPFEMLEVDDVFISGLILPLEESVDKEKAKGIRCEGFGRMDEWAISGYEDGSPVIWVSTDIADYDCLKPSGGYKKHYDQFFAKASASVEVYKNLTKSSGGNPNLTLDELLAGVVDAMSGMKCFSGVASIWDFVIFQGEFIYNQLIGLDETSKKTDQLFVELPVLAALRDKCTCKLANLAQSKAGSSVGSSNIGSEEIDGNNMNYQSGSSSCPLEDDEDLKLARILREQKYWRSVKPKKGIKTKKNIPGPASNKKASNVEKKEKKRSSSQITKEPTSRKMPKKAAACLDFKEKCLQISKNSDVIEMIKDQSLKEEAVAILLTAGQEDGRPCRRLVDYIFHSSDGIPQPFEMLEVDDVFISGLILPLEDSVDKEKAIGVRSVGFGRIEEWVISGYEDGSPVIWVSTHIADYDCLKPSGGYKKHYDQFFAKASASVVVYRKLSISCGGNPNLTLDELLAGVVRAMSGMKCFSGVASIREFVISQGEFIYNQLIGLDETSKKTDQLLLELPVLAALRDECTSNLENLAQTKAGSLNIGPEERDVNNMSHHSGSLSCPLEEDDDLKFARLLHDDVHWHSMKEKKSQDVKKKKNKTGSATKMKAFNVQKREKKRSGSRITEEPASQKKPKRAASCFDFKEKLLQMSKKSDVIDIKKDQSVKEEAVAIRLTSGEEYGRPCRRLVDYIFHDSDGIPQPFEMLEVDDVFISGLILPLEESVDKEKARGVRCEGFGRIEEWAISGYEDGSPVIWVSTDIADYDCLKPSGGYKKHYDLFFAKANASVEVYKKLSKSSAGNPDLTLDELLAVLVSAMSCMKCFSGVASIREFVISQGEFIYYQLIGLDETSKETDQSFLELPVLVALRDECRKLANVAQMSDDYCGDFGSTFGVKKMINKPGPAFKKRASNFKEKEEKRYCSQIAEESTSRKFPNRATSGWDFKEMPLQMSKKLDVIEMKKDKCVEEEAVAITLTAGQEDGRPCRRLVDYIFHNSDGIPQPFEMLEVDNIFISGLILPLEESVDKEKVKGVRCEGFGRVEEWAISGYEEGSPVIWVSTDIADYDCLKPSVGYKKHYDLFFAKASASVVVYRKLSKSCGGNPNLTLDELLAGVVRAMSGMKCFSGVASIREFVISQGEFIYSQLIGLDETSNKTDQSFLELPVLAALRDECRKLTNVAQISDDYCGDFGSTFGVKKKINKRGPAFKKRASNLNEKEEKRYCSQIAEEFTSQKIPNRAAAGWDFKEKPLQMSKKLDVIEMKKDKCVEEEAVAITLTAGQEDGRPCRRLVDYIFHNSDGIPQPFEMLEFDNIFISGLILPLEESVDKEKVKGVRCEGFGRVEEWAISGYEEGSTVIWVSTDIADYDCLKPSGGYKKHYDQFFAKASASVVVYRKLSISCGGNPNLTLDELLAGVVRAMSGMKCFSGVASIREFVISQGEFIYNQLIGLDETSNKTDQSFLELPVLAALRDECRKLTNVAQISDDYCGDFGSTFGVKKKINKRGPAFKKRASNLNEKEEKRYCSQIAKESTSQKIPNRAAAGWDFKEKPLQMSKKLDVIEMKKDKCVEEEAVAITLTAGQEDGRPCRRLVDYIFHNSDGIPQPFEMLEFDNIFISGLILPLEESVDKEKVKGVRCEGFGRVEEWAISGYEEGSTVIWVSTDIADYDCLKPSGGYKKHYDQFFAKASASVVVYRKLSKSCGGNPNLTLDELLAGVVRAMSGMKCFSGVASIREFVISQGEFIYSQLIGLDETSNKTDQSFLELPVLAALRDECRKLTNVAQISDDYCGDFGSTFGVKKKINKRGPAFKKRASNLNEKEEKRYCSQIAEESTSQKIPNRAATGWDFKEKPLQMSKKLDVIEMKKDKCVEEEAVAITLTAGQEDGRPCRRLVDYIFHNSDGIPQPFEMLEFDNIFISGLILPLEESVDKEKVKGVRCEGFGRVEEWAISGYEEGSTVIWVSTDIADYDCLKPSGGYKKHYDQFFAKASASVVVYRKLSISCGGNPNLTLDELLAGVVRAMSGMKCFSGVASIREFVISQGEFIYNQLIGLDETSNKTDQSFLELPVLAALRDECSRLSNLAETKDGSLAGSLKVGSKEIDGNSMNHQSGSSDCPLEEDKDVKLARLLHDEKYWRSMKPKKSLGSSSLSSKYCIKINEVEIANDYPCPAHYSTSNPEMDEYLLYDRGDDICYMDDLPRRMLHNWALYNIDLRMISLELLPMKPCAEIDVTIYGSGVMTSDDGFGYHLETDPDQSSSSGSGISEIDGIPIYLSAIKEWTIEFKSSMFFVSIRTDMAWYRLGKPSKQYAPWYGPVLKTARLAISIITLLKVQTRVARLSFADVIKRVSNFEKDHPAYISSKADVVERYVVVHGQIILQQFSEFPDDNIKQCAFVDGLAQKMEERHQTKWLVKKKKVVQRNKSNLNPRAGMSPIFSKRKAMQATTTRLINRIWGEYYSNYSPEELNDGNISDMKEDINEDEEVEELEENEEDNVLEERKVLPEKPQTPFSSSRQTKSFSTSKEVKWIGESVGKNYSSKTLYKSAIVHDNEIAVGGVVLVENDESDEVMYFVEYMYEKSNRSQMFHGRLMERGSQTVLGNAANEREVFLTNECMDFKLEDAKQIVAVQIRTRPWGHQHRKENAIADKIDRIRAQERKTKGLPPEYYCKSLYSPEKGAFFSLPINEMGLGSGLCHSCKLKEIDSDKENFEINASLTSFVYLGTQYSVYDYIYVNFHQFSAKKVEREIYRAGRNVGLKAYVVCQVLKIMTSNATRKAEPDSTQVKIRRFFRPDDISEEMVYCSDIREIYYSDETHTIAVDAIEGKCEVRKKHDLRSEEVPTIFDHVFFCERQYDSSKGSLKQMPSHIKLRYSPTKLSNDHDYMKKRGKCKGENDLGVEKLKLAFQENYLATLDIFSGCGGLSEGLQQSGVSITKWAIEYEEAAGDAFKLNHPASLVLINNCNVILRAVMQKCGDADDCLSTPEAADLAASLDQEEVDNLPLPGQVDFINGGPPCQGFSGMNRFNHSTWSKVQCEMILAFLSFADYYRPKYFLLENVRNFVSFNQGQTFRLTLASLLEIGYQVRFGILEAGAYGLPQSRKRAFIWAASPDEVLPDWPEPMHVFATPELKITLSGNSQYVAMRSTANGAPFRPSTVRDTIGDLPAVVNGSSKTIMEYRRDPLSWFQKRIRGNSVALTDHITKEMNELNFIRCQRIPKRPGADWRNFPNEKVKLSTGQVVDLIPWCLTNTAKRHNQWKGLFGRLDWEGNFPISVTDPQPMGKVGLCFHPEQDRIVTVRECARSQGFQDSYKFSGNILQKHRQIGNAVPPPLAYALGRKLKEAINSKRSAC